jgi:transcriptional regulator with XRE-family HTH domain
VTERPVVTFRQYQVELGKRIQKARWLLGWSQLTAAEKADLDYRYYRRLEAGKVNPRLETLYHLAHALNRRASELIDVEPAPRGSVPLAEATAEPPPTGRPPKQRRRR